MMLLASGNPCATPEIAFAAPRLEELTASPKFPVTATFFSLSTPHQSALPNALDTNGSGVYEVSSSPGASTATSLSIPLRI